MYHGVLVISFVCDILLIVRTGSFSLHQLSQFTEHLIDFMVVIVGDIPNHSRALFLHVLVQHLYGIHTSIVLYLVSTFLIIFT